MPRFLFFATVILLVPSFIFAADPIFPYGAVYFRKSNPPEQDWERDHKTAAQIGMNTFRHWFMWSAITVKLNDCGFGLTKNRLFWLTATPVILGSLLRIPYGLIVSRFGRMCIERASQVTLHTTLRASPRLYSRSIVSGSSNCS